MLGEAVMAKSEPMPVKPITMGFASDESPIVMEPVVLPRNVGLKVTLTEQLALGAKTPQLSVWAKLPAATTLEIVSETAPTLVTVMAWGVLDVVSA